MSHSKTCSDRKFECKECDKKFLLLKNLTEHNLTVHTDRTNIVKPKKIVQADGTIMYECDECQKLFKARAHVFRHKEGVHSAQDQPKKFQCPKCPFSTNVQTNFVGHSLIHMPRKHICEQCGLGFTTKTCLKNHFEIRHTHGESYMCDYCAKPFNNARSLKTHVRICTRESNKGCEICGKTFKSSSNLRQHLNVTHSDERPHVCDHCGKAFKVKNKLQRHQKEGPCRNRKRPPKEEMPEELELSNEVYD